VRDYLLLLGRFLRQPRSVGAIAPSSQVLARAMVRGLDLGGARVVELGPGTGAFTGTLVAGVAPGGRLLAIELDADFAANIHAKWPSAECVCASATSLAALAAERGLMPVDHIVSGLPFASLPREVTRAILDGIERVLRPGGTFSAFQYVHAYGLPPAVAFRRDLSRRFGPLSSRRLVLRNVPPAFVLRWTRGQ